MSAPLSGRAVGLRGLLVEVPDVAHALALAAAARTAVAAGDLAVGEVVPAAVTVLFDDVGSLPDLQAFVAAWEPSASVPPGPDVELPVAYDGPDLAEVAARWGTDEAGAVARHTGVEFVSAFCGFAPGFAYLSGLPPELAVPRRATPRPVVPAGSVALADTWCGVYPGASPGGWLLLGRTPARLWDASRAEPALLAPGTRVAFVPA